MHPHPSSFKGTNATYLGEDTLAQGKAWHVKAKDDSGNPFEAWVRESDGYPLKYASTMQGTTFTATFDRFGADGQCPSGVGHPAIVIARPERIAAAMLAVGVLAACGGPGTPLAPPAAKDILSKPNHANLKDAPSW
jgi:hypothetical protein